MAWTAAEVSDLVESLVNEYNAAKYWATNEITLYVKAAMSTLLSKYMPWLYHTYGDWADLALTADEPDYTIPAAAYRMQQIIIKETGRKLRWIPRTELWKYRNYDAGDDAGWTYKGNKIHIIPTPSASSTAYLEAHYMPILDATTEFPDCMSPLIAAEAATLALLKDKHESVGLHKVKKAYEMNVYVELCMFTPEVHFPDFQEEDSLA